MELCLNIRDYLEDPSRPLHQQVDEAVEVARKATQWGYTAIYCPQHYVSHPTVWPQPMPVLARLMPEAPDVRLVTGILLLTYMNPLDVAEQVATFDQLSKGRFVLGVGLGYRELELEAFNTNRSERLSRFNESLEVMKLLWSGDEVNFDGRYWHIHGARMAITPMQQPHPPIWFASHSPRATRRAANDADGCLLGPQTAWDDISSLASIYWETRQASGNPAGTLGMHRCVAMSTDPETAAAEARAVGERKGAMYGGWGMQEDSVVDLGLDRNRSLHEWTIIGSPQDCLERLSNCETDEPSPIRRPHLHQLPRIPLRPHGIPPALLRRSHPETPLTPCQSPNFRSSWANRTLRPPSPTRPYDATPLTQSIH